VADFVFNIAKSRVIELCRRVDNNDPTNSVLLVVPVLTAGLETDAVLKDKADLAAVFSGTTDEATANGWNRKTLDDTAIADNSLGTGPDNTNDRYDFDLPDQTWTAVSASAVSKLVVAYDSDSTGGTDANIVPMTSHDFAITPDGSDVVVVWNAAGFFRAA
jgi:hypothetical protein